MSDIYNRTMPARDPQFTPLSAEALAQQWADQSDEKHQNQLIVAVDGTVIGWGHCGLYQQRSNLMVGYHEFTLLPQWEQRGIEQAAILYFEARVSTLLRARSAEQAIYKIFLSESDTRRIDILKDLGYSQLAAHAHMVRPNLENIPALNLLEGIEFRPFQPEHLREVYDTYREAFREHIHGTEPSDEDFAEWTQMEYLADRSLWVVAWDAQTNRVIGSILNFIPAEENAYYHRQRGYVEYISVLPAYRQRGIAGAMIAASLQKHKERGMAEAALSSHTENPFNPISLYLKMGFVICCHTLVFSKPIIAQPPTP